MKDNTPAAAESGASTDSDTEISLVCSGVLQLEVATCNTQQNTGPAQNEKNHCRFFIDANKNEASDIIRNGQTEKFILIRKYSENRKQESRHTSQAKHQYSELPPWILI